MLRQPSTLAALRRFGISPEALGVIIVDHGSRSETSNEMLLEIVEDFRRRAGYAIVEPAHMELAEPSIAAAFGRCVERGAKLIVVFPYLLLPGRHWKEDIPRLAAEAAEQHPGVPFLVAAPFARHPGMIGIIDDRVGRCLARAGGEEIECDVCDATSACGIQRKEQPKQP